MITSVNGNNFCYKPAVKAGKLKTSVIKYNTDLLDLSRKNFSEYETIPLNFRGIIPDGLKDKLNLNTEKKYSEEEKEFIKFRDEISKALENMKVEKSKYDWDEYTGNNQETALKNLGLALSAGKLILSSRKLNADKTLVKLDQFNQGAIKDKTLKRHLKELSDQISNYTFDDMESMEIDASTNHIEIVFDQYRGNVNGEEYSYQELGNLLEDEADAKKRKEIYEAINGVGEEFGGHIKHLIKDSNELARTKGYDNYFSMQLKERYNIDEKEFFTLLNELEEKTNEVAENFYSKVNEKLADKFGIKPDELQPWHYDSKLKDNTVKEADKYIKSEEDLLPLAQSLFAGMGWNLKSMPIKYDLSVKKNKSQQDGFCIHAKTPGDSRILLHLTRDLYSLQKLIHETGHSVYNEGISKKLPYLDRRTPTTAINEAVAFLMESLPYKEKGFLEKELSMPEALVEKLNNSRRKELLHFARTYLVLINFEKEMYKNPDQNLDKLWVDLNKKYKKRNIPEVNSHEWKTVVPRFIHNPAYLPNHLLGAMMAEQMYGALTKDGTPMTENPKTAEILKDKLFKYGASKTEDELMNNLTGSSLKPDAFLKQFENINLD